jgi:hypothetical protein
MPDTKLCHLAVLIIVAGCTTQAGRDQHADSVNAADVQCHSEQLTGTMLSKTVCTTAAQRAAAQADADNLRKAAVQSGGCRSGSGAGC